MKARLGLTVLLTVVLAGCGDDGGSPTSPSAPPPAVSPTPAQAEITVGLSSAQVLLSDRAGWRYRVSYIVTITEKAGLDARINFLRLELWHRDGRYERTEVGANTIITALGDNLVKGKSTWANRVWWYFNLDNLDGGVRLTASFTDAKGNYMEAVFRSGPYAGLTAETARALAAIQ